MRTKLTLRVNPLLIRQAKVYAKQHGKSVSQVVGDYFSLLSHTVEPQEPHPLPLTRSLKGALKGKSFSEKNYKKHLEKKYL